MPGGSGMVVAPGPNKLCELFPKVRSAPEIITGVNRERRASGLAAEERLDSRDVDQLIQSYKSTDSRRSQ
jgi:hypothetical protein